MALAEFLARQLRQPSGMAGRAMAYILNRANRPINERAVERLGVRPTDNVLEIGFGGGVALAKVLGRTQGFVAGIEISDPMIRHVRRRFRREIEAGRVEVRHGDVSDLPYEDARFDRAFTVQTIYFWPDPRAGLREIRRVLKPGGLLLVATAAKEEMDKRSFTDHGFRKFERRDLESLLREAGFADASVERDGPRMFSTGRRP
jgi:ubiquinone/menaquinone biosynthesis C-methylase UbiE